ncbi:MAG: hypothetical protein ACM3UU_00450 [Ignavibacteriales bacterium]
MGKISELMRKINEWALDKNVIRRIEELEGMVDELREKKQEREKEGLVYSPRVQMGRIIGLSMEIKRLKKRRYRFGFINWWVNF